METSPRLVVVGGSAGAFEEMRTLMLRFPSDLPAAVILCLHTRTHEGPRLAQVLGLRAPLPVRVAEDGLPIEPSHAYVAPGNHHVFVRGGKLWLSTGPTENYARPSIDVLFRSAAVASRERCVGAILSGLNEDGALGLSAIVRCGGMGFVQDPESARYDRMPNAALRLVPEAKVAETWSLAELIVERMRQTPRKPHSPCPRDVLHEDEIAFQAGRTAAAMADLPPGEEAFTSCPQCGGPVYHVLAGDDAPRHFRCRMGHAYTERVFLGAHRRELLRALWAAQRLLQERARILERMPTGEARSAQYKSHALAVHTLLDDVVATGDAEESTPDLPDEQDEAR
jgi:two-component system chemotaxis response regulator CheB